MDFIVKILRPVSLVGNVLFRTGRVSFATSRSLNYYVYQINF